MGGCCSSSSRKLQFNGTPVYYCYPPAAAEGHEAVVDSRESGVATLVASAISTHDLNLNMSIDTFRRPPTPIPYDAVFGSKGVVLKDHCVNLDESKCKSLLPSSPPRKHEVELVVSERVTLLSDDEEDCCPTCLEEYDEDNPKITTKCGHQFHLSCILEWMERSETCPICDQEMVYET